MSQLNLYTIYHRPEDHLGVEYLVRLWSVGHGGDHPVAGPVIGTGGHPGRGAAAGAALSGHGPAA